MEFPLVAASGSPLTREPANGSGPKSFLGLELSAKQYSKQKINKEKHRWHAAQPPTKCGGARPITAPCEAKFSGLKKIRGGAKQLVSALLIRCWSFPSFLFRTSCTNPSNNFWCRGLLRGVAPTAGPSSQRSSSTPVKIQSGRCVGM